MNIFFKHRRVFQTPPGLNEPKPHGVRSTRGCLKNKNNESEIPHFPFQLLRRQTTLPGRTGSKEARPPQTR